MLTHASVIEVSPLFKWPKKKLENKEIYKIYTQNRTPNKPKSYSTKLKIHETNLDINLLMHIQN